MTVSAVVGGLRLTGIPQRKGTVDEVFDGRYRVWTAGHGVPFELFPELGHRGWASVSIDGWNCNSMNRRWNPGRGGWDSTKSPVFYVFQRPSGVRHPRLDGVQWATVEDGLRAAYEEGLLGIMVYDRVAGDHGLLDAVCRYEDVAVAAERDRQTCVVCRLWMDVDHRGLCVQVR